MDSKQPFEMWIEFAEHDLQSAEYLRNMHPKPLEVICYLCQQSAEKSLKAFLIRNGEEPPKTHDLALLCNLCGEIKDISQIADRCDELNPYCIQARYPYGVDMLDSDAERAIESARMVFDTIANSV